MKLFILCLALVAVSYCQNEDDCDLSRSWSVWQTGGNYVGGTWEDEQIYAWGMDGDNKWYDFWHFSYDPPGRTDLTHYEYVTCRNGVSLGSAAVPSYVQTCGSCTLSGADCQCYPYVDVAGSYQISASPTASGSESEPQAPEGWTGSYENANPPYEIRPAEDGSIDTDWNLQNCKQYQPEYVYYYTYRLKISRKSGKFYKSFGISRGFKPSRTSWSEFCDNLFPEDDDDIDRCYVPSSSGSDKEESLQGSHYSYQMGEYRQDEETDRIQFFHHKFESGCHIKDLDHTWPTSVYCGDASGWTFGAGATAHVRFGCDTSTFQDTATDAFDIDDGDCRSVYLQFDQMNPLTPTVEEYDTNSIAYGTGKVTFPNPVESFTGLVFVNGLGSECWYESSFVDHRSDVPSYRTPCSAGVLAVPFVALMSTIFVALRNMF